MALDTIAGMAPVVGDRPVRPLTADEVIRMEEQGVLDEPQRVELLLGQLVEKSVRGEPHELVKARLLKWLAAGLAAGHYGVRVEGAFRVPDRTSLPEPDVAVLPPSEELGHPSAALLVIEVAVTSLRTDVAVKGPLFAAAGIPEYWVIDVDAREVVVHTDPRADGYANVARVGDSRPAPRALNADPLDLEWLFAGLSSA